MLRFVTSNRHKFLEFKWVAERFGLDIEIVGMKYREVQSDRLEEIARQSCLDLAGRLGKGFFLEDAGLFIEALGGFPGPYSAYVHSTIGNQGVLRLLRGLKKRSALFLSVICYYDGSCHIFRGEVKGEIARRSSGRSGFGFDPIFIPEGHRETFAEMGPKKHRISHRARSAEIFFRTLTQRGAGKVL